MNGRCRKKIGNPWNVVGNILGILLNSGGDIPAQYGGEELGYLMAEITVLDTPQARRADFAVEVDGDSMEPDFHSGDIALVKFDPDVPVGEVGLFVLDGMGYIKERGKKKLISRNPEYPDIEGEARCIGLVIGVAELV